MININHGVNVKYDWKIIKSAKELSEFSQKEKFPYFMDPKDVFGLKIQVNRHVFSPRHAKAYRFFILRLPDATSMRILEVGCGHGVVSCYLAKKAEYVLATDIIKEAVENTRINAKHNKLDNLETRLSNVYSGIMSGERFDLIFWNTPWAKVPPYYESDMKPEDYGMFDVDYRAVTRFIMEGGKILREGGVIYLGTAVQGGDIKLIEETIKKAGLKKEVVADDYFEPGERINGKLVRFRLMLLKLS